MANDKKTNDGSFLGGAGKFNIAGHNAPLPGESVSDVKPPPPFGGPKVWFSAIAIVIVLAVLFFFYEAPSFNHRTVNPPVDPSQGLSLDPDH